MHGFPIRIYIYIYIYIYTHTFIHTFIHTYVSTYAETYINTYTNARTHKHTAPSSSRSCASSRASSSLVQSARSSTWKHAVYEHHHHVNVTSSESDHNIDQPLTPSSQKCENSPKNSDHSPPGNKCDRNPDCRNADRADGVDHILWSVVGVNNDVAMRGTRDRSALQDSDSVIGRLHMGLPQGHDHDQGTVLVNIQR
jgi:hypothetical protein